VGSQVEARLGPAVEALDALLAEGVPPFDFAFVDADKRGYGDYFDRCMKLVRPGLPGMRRCGKHLTRAARTPRCAWAA
jgi:predicted O-methyltransferase YrrM